MMRKLTGDQTISLAIEASLDELDTTVDYDNYTAKSET